VAQGRWALTSESGPFFITKTTYYNKKAYKEGKKPQAFFGL
jgi:hypothetical protein